MGRKIIGIAIVLAVVAVLIVSQRYRLILAFATTGEPIAQLTDANPVPGGVPFVGERHFSVVQLDEATFAIAEPTSWARNVNYLIIGEQRALLFDAGVGFFDIRPVVASLTDLPITFMPSHFHYDHTGQGTWDHFALVDLPHVRERADGNSFQPRWDEHFGASEAVALPTWQISEWVAPNSFIDLGERRLQLIYTPGHTNNSVSLLDAERELLFTGDFISGSGSLSSFLPTSRLGDYLQSSEKVLRKTRQMESVVLRGAHAPPANTIPLNLREDVVVLRDQLKAIRDGELQGNGVYPIVYAIKSDMELSTEPGFLQNWRPTYPDEHPANQ